MSRCAAACASARRSRQPVAGVLAALALVSAFAAALSLHAQTLQRHFPANALRGRIHFLQPPEIQINGEAARLAPGSRIRGTNNLLVMSGSLVDQSYVVNYNFDTLGLVRDVWILSDEERANRPWPSTTREAQAWSFNEMTQKWSRR